MNFQLPLMLYSSMVFKMQKNNKVAVVMGSDSDLSVMIGCIRTLKDFGVEYEARIISAHRTPDEAEEFSKNAYENGFGVIIAAAGKAAHLGGVIAANTALPVLGVPIKSSTMDGLDSLLSIVQMPSGIPVATLAIDGAVNAALFAVQILSLSDQSLVEKINKYKIIMANDVKNKDSVLKQRIEEMLNNK